MFKETGSLDFSNIKKEMQEQYKEQIEEIKKENVFVPPKRNITPEEPPVVYHNHVFVNKWIEHGSKYGLGYQMSDLVTLGVNYRDNTRLMAIKNSRSFTYFSYEDRKEVAKEYSFDMVPDELKKKVTLYRKFFAVSKFNQSIIF